MFLTYTGGMEVAGPGWVSRVGKGVSAHACSTSSIERVGGKVATLSFGGGTETISVSYKFEDHQKEIHILGITSELNLSDAWQRANERFAPRQPLQ